MEYQFRETVRLPDELYDRVMERLKDSGSAQDFVAEATRFWLQVSEVSGEPLPRLTAAQEALARRLLHFLFATSAKQREGILLLMEDWYDRRRE